MRLLFFLAGLLWLTWLPAQATDPYAAIADRLAEYGRLTMDWNLEALLDLTDPELFEFVPRAVIYDQLAGLSSDENMDVQFADFTVDRIGELISHDGVDYVPVDFHHEMRFTMKSAAYQEPQVLQRMARMLEKSYGQVTVDEAQTSVRLTARKSMFAIRRAPTDAWYFVEFRPENSAMIDLLVPPVVREQFKK
ncbi:MAG: hypothetical protein AAFZ52_08850 [Bacteroidota bacterium]